MKINLVILVCLLTINIYGKDKFIDVRYNRPGISVLLLNDCKSFFSNENYATSIYPPDQFYLNKTTSEWIVPTSISVQGIEMALQEKKIPALSMSNLCTLNELSNRVKYNLTDVEVQQLKAANRGIETVKDEPWLIKIIENNYILVLNYKNIKTQEQVDNTKDAAYIALGALTGTDQSHERLKEGYYAQAEAFLYKIELNNVDITTFWENWNDLKKQKTQNYNIRLVASKVCSVNGTQFKGDGGDLKTLLLNASIYQSLNQLGEIYNTVLPKTGIISIHPIKAVIGKKEGIETEQPFSVYENRINSSNEIYTKRVGYIKVTKVLDNRVNSNGNTTSSQFYKAGWGSVKPGMFILPESFSGFDVSICYGFKTLTNYSLRVGFNVSKQFNLSSIPNLKLYADLGYQPEIVDNNQLFKDNNYLNANKLWSYYYGVGLEKDIYIFGGFQLTPFVALINESARYKNTSDVKAILGNDELPNNYGSLIYLVGGGRFSINITNHLKAVYSYSLSTRDFKTTKGIGSGSKYSNYPDEIVSDNFAITTNLGLKYEF